MEKHKAVLHPNVENSFGLIRFGALADSPPKEADPKPASGDSTANSVTLTVGGWTITITAGVEADAQCRFYAVPRRNYVFDDDYKIAVNARHLLSTGNSVADDRTAAIIGKAAEIVAEGVKKALTPAPPGVNTDPFLVSFRTNNWEETSWPALS